MAKTTPSGLPAEIDPTEAFERVKRGELTLVDIRTPSEMMRSGVADGAIALPVTGPQFVGQLLEVIDNDTTRPVAFICASGARSGQVQAYLAANGFTQAANVVEGMMGSFKGPGWLKRGLPTIPFRG
jgi:rhodanese-related sulfurtransferase